MQVATAFKTWLTNPYFDRSTRDELAAISDKPQEIEDRFYRNLEFGTGGLRGVLGAGTNRMNKYVVRQATQGLAAYIAGCGEEAGRRGVVIAHDSRRFSHEFSVEAALVLAANSITAYVFEDLRPTPELSFAVRELGAIAGIVVTASHNPPQYNGYKVYWEDGGQIPPERAEEILACIEGIQDITTIHPLDSETAKAKGLYREIGEEVDRKYLERIKGLVVNPAVLQSMAPNCKIIYTPLHGAGNMPVRRALRELGFEQVLAVPEQEAPDPDFSTLKYPNPEDPKAFSLALELAKRESPDLIMATDPDADRIGVVVRDTAGQYRQLSGNQTGVLLTHYILSQLQASGRLSKNGVVVKTIVTTDMILPIAKDFGVRVDQTLTGFKFIGEKIHDYELSGDSAFLFGFEESYGYLAGTFVRDKDAVCAAVLIAEAAAYYKSGGKTLFQALEELWARYGCYLEDLHTITLEGITGREKTARLMAGIRSMGFRSFAGYDISQVEDYLSGEGKDLQNGETYRLTLPKSDVVKFRLSEGGYVVFRPSGTEPKAKLYISLAGKDPGSTAQALQAVKQELLAAVDSILSD